MEQKSYASRYKVVSFQRCAQSAEHYGISQNNITDGQFCRTFQVVIESVNRDIWVTGKMHSNQIHDPSSLGITREIEQQKSLTYAHITLAGP